MAPLRLQLLPPGERFVFEFRDPSWFCREVYDVLRQHDWCLAIAHCTGEAGQNLGINSPHWRARLLPAALLVSVLETCLTATEPATHTLWQSCDAGCLGPASVCLPSRPFSGPPVLHAPHLQMRRMGASWRRAAGLATYRQGPTLPLRTIRWTAAAGGSMCGSTGPRGRWDEGPQLPGAWPWRVRGRMLNVRVAGLPGAS